MPKLESSVATAGRAAETSAGQFVDMASAEDQLHDKLITIETDYINKTYGTGGVGYEPPHAAAGGEFVIPAGYNENYRVGPYVASSGETVTITPQGGQRGAGSGGNTYVTINDKLAGKLYLEGLRQKQLAQMERRL